MQSKIWLYIWIILSLIILFTKYNYLEKLSWIYFTFFSLKFINDLGKSFPLKELILSISSLQLLIMPILTYERQDYAVMYEMEIDSLNYFKYVLLAMAAFTIALYIPLKKNSNANFKLIEFIKSNNDNFYSIGWYMVILGFIFQLTSSFFPGQIAFIVGLLSEIKFAGALCVLFSNRKNKQVPLILVSVYLFLSIIAGGVFINLFIWGSIMMCYYFIVYSKTFVLKISLIAIGIFSAFLVQSIKSEFRQKTWGKDNNNETELSETDVFIELTGKQLQEGSGLFNEDNINTFISRLNQGWILSKVLNHIPEKEDYLNGETLNEELIGILLPRFLAPNKVTAGGDRTRDKFKRFTGRELVRSTTMNVGYLADGYGNYGFFGGIFFVFLFALSINLIYSIMISKCYSYPILFFWIPVAFFYTMRSGNDFYIIANYMFKASILIVVIFTLFKHSFMRKTNIAS